MPTKLAEKSGVVFMFILIDGYNLIRQSESLRHCERKSLEAGRTALIRRLAEYQKKKAHGITVVFDGGQSDWIDEGRDREGKINIIYSRFGEKADDVIKRLAAQIVGDLIVVSSDREISSYVRQLGKTPLASPDFEAILNKALSAPARPVTQTTKSNVHEQQAKKKGPSRRLPRAKRRAQTKIEKL